MDINKRVKLSLAQADFLTSESSETVFCSGVGGGKTFALAMRLWLFSTIPGSVGLLSAPTHDQVKTATWRGVEEAISRIGLQDGVDYVVGTRPPPEWNVKPFTKLSNARVITWRSGSYTIVSGLDRFNNIRGAEFDYVLVDEFRDLKFSDVRKVIQGRMRGQAFTELGKQHQIFWVSTPPDDVKELKDLIQKPHVRYVQGTTHDNISNLPPEYVSSLSNYDSTTYDREVLGKIVDNEQKNLFAYSYDKDYSFVDFEEYGYELDNSIPLRMSFDFNVNPITCIIGQSTTEKIRIFKSFSEPNSDCSQLCEKIKAWLPPKEFILQITGDANGFKRDTRGNLNDYQIITKAFGLTGYQILAPKQNPSIRDSRVLCNSLLQNFDVAINSKNCTELDEDLRYVQMDENQKIDKKKHGAHSLDNFRYYCHTFHSDFLKRSYGNS